MTKILLAEGIGTFALVFCGTGAIVINEMTQGVVTHPGISAVFGLVVMAMIYSFGSQSGAHINPAVSFAFYLDNKLDKERLLGYILAQVTGALLASIFLYMSFPQPSSMGMTLPAGSEGQSFLLEIILTFLLMLTIFRVSSSADTARFTALAVGGVVGLEALFAGPITGASMNPARSLAPAIVAGHYESLWIYMLAPILGASLAWLVHRLLED